MGGFLAGGSRSETNQAQKMGSVKDKQADIDQNTGYLLEDGGIFFNDEKTCKADERCQNEDDGNGIVDLYVVICHCLQHLGAVHEFFHIVICFDCRNFRISLAEYFSFICRLLPRFI